MSISGLSKSLLDAASSILEEGNTKDVRYHQLLEDYGVTSPYELSEGQQNVFVVHAGKLLGEDFYGIQELKKRIVWRGGISNLDEVNETVKEIMEKEALDEKYVGFKKLEKKLEKKDGKKAAGAIAASVGKKKYGAAKFKKAAADHKKMKDETPKKKA